MALITTNLTLGWYGVHGGEPCQPLDLGQHFGTYTAGKQFVPGTLGMSESDLDNFKLQIWTHNSDGTGRSWNLFQEKLNFNSYSTLNCGQMYWIIYYGTKDLNVPGFVPTALDVDMGRITA
jgi:hypothetical protein